MFLYRTKNGKKTDKSAKKERNTCLTVGESNDHAMSDTKKRKYVPFSRWQALEFPSHM